MARGISSPPGVCLTIPFPLPFPFPFPFPSCIAFPIPVPFPFPSSVAFPFPFPSLFPTPSQSYYPHPACPPHPCSGHCYWHRGDSSFHHSALRYPLSSHHPYSHPLSDPNSVLEQPQSRQACGSGSLVAQSLSSDQCYHTKRNVRRLI